MIMNVGTRASLTTKALVKPVLSASAVTVILTGMVMMTSLAHAAPEITVSSSASGSTTVVEQYADGKTATITATPNGITMQDGMPYAVTQVTTVPRYVTRQSPVSQGSPAVTSMPVTRQVQVTTTTLDALQLTPTFSTPNVVKAQTQVMKNLKNSAGREVAVPASHIAPGDVIEYHTTYTNATAQPVTDINAMVALPNGVQLVSLNSPLPTLVSTGGDRYQAIQQVGNTVAIQEDYSALKWNLVNLDPNAAQTVVIRAKVQ